MKMNKKSFNDMLNEELNSLPREIAPERDLWTGIERAIVTEAPQHTSRSRVKPWMGVAACSVAAVLSIVVTMQREPNNAVVIADFFETQKQSLLVKYKEQPALTDNWQTQLVELESAEAAIRKALEADPQNAALLRMLSQVYQQQLDLINKVHQPTWQQI